MVSKVDLHANIGNQAGNRQINKLNGYNGFLQDRHGHKSYDCNRCSADRQFEKMIFTAE